MRHGSKKVKFADGQDSDQMLMRKLVVNFFLNGKISTTATKIKALKPKVERIVTKIKSNTESDKNYLLKKLGGRKVALEKIFKEVAEQLKNVAGGYTKIVKSGYRDSDGASTSSLIWAHTVVMSPVEKANSKTSKTKDKTKKEVKNKKI